MLAGGATQVVSVAVAVLPVPPLVDVTVTELVPPVVAVTLTEKEHEPLAAIEPPVSITTFELATAVTELPAPHWLAAGVIAGVPATVMPSGNVSVNPTPVTVVPDATLFGLVIVNVNVELPPGIVFAGANALAITGGATTVNVGVLLVVPVPPSVEVIVPVVFGFAPGVVPVTLTWNVHDDPAAGDAVSEPFDRLTMLVPAVAEIVPIPQAPTTTGGDATTSPVGSESLNAIPFNADAVFPFVIVNDSEVVPLRGMVAAPNALLIVGGAITVRFAVAVAVFAPNSVLARVTLLGFTPAVVPVTFTVTEQDAFAASVLLARLTVPAPVPAVTAPLHVLTTLGIAATTSPPGSVSV